MTNGNHKKLNTGRFWRKALAASLALLIVSGSVPIKPISNVFESMVVTAEAVEEVTKEFSNSNIKNGSTGQVTYNDELLFSAVGNETVKKTNSSGQVKLLPPINNEGAVEEGTVRFYPHISGKVKSIVFSSAYTTTAGGYVKFGKGSTWTNPVSETMTGNNPWTSISFTNSDGIQLDNEDDYLEIKLFGTANDGGGIISNGSITVTYEPTSSVQTHTHNFSYSQNGSTLTATCAHNDGMDCSLASDNWQISTTLTPPTHATYAPNVSHPATLSNIAGFTTETGATAGDITYVNNTTNESLGTSSPHDVGAYTASVTINAGGTDYTLTTSFRVGTFSGINTNYPQFTTDKEGNYAIDGETVTLTFTPQFGETLTGVTATGATSGNDITLTAAGANTYTFTMPGENVNIGATFSISENDFAQTGENEYTIKTANGWGWFCFALNSGLVPDGFSGKTVKLATDVESSEMAGTSNHPFKGTFDGQNHTLTFNHEASKDLSAPFHYINGATISNLHVEGTITGGTYESLGGLVGHAEGNITIENCHVSTQISTTVSGSALHGGVIGTWNGTNATCTVTGCVYDGLIYNPNEAGVTTSCHGFIGWDYGNYGTIKFTDCLSAPAAYGTGKYALGGNCFTFVFPNSEPTLTYYMTNCYYTSILGNRQGRPATTATTAPANLGNATTDHGLVDGYENGFLYNDNYYTPKYGDAVVDYDFDEWNERASVTFNGKGDNFVGVNIDEEVSNVKSVTYNYEFREGKAAIVILPFDYICSGSEGGTFYAFEGVNGNQLIMEDSNKLTSLTANTPYLFMPSGTTLSFPNIANMTDGYVTLQPASGYFVSEFVSELYSITIHSLSNGTVTADRLYARKGDKVTLTVTPNAGYAVKIVAIAADEIPAVEITPVDGVYSFTMPASDVTVTAVFEEGINYTLVPAVEPTYLAAGNSEYYTGSDGKYYVLVNGEYQEIAENSWVIPQLTLVHHEAVAPTCTANGNIEYWYDEANNKYFSDANGENEITQADTVKAATNHDWNAPTYSWTAVDGGYKCTATRTCKNNAGHEETEEATVTYAEITAPTAGAKGLGRYTATFTNSAFAVQTKDVEIEMLTPEYADATYTWADDNSSVTAEKKCLNGGADITETVNTTSQITKPATCKAMGETTYYAVFTNGAFAKQEKTVANIEKLAHTPAQAVVENRVEPTYDADGSYDSVVYCSECGEELSRETIVIPKLEKTEVIINSIDINGNQVSATVYKETFTDADYTLPKDEYYDGYDFEGWNINGTTYNTADSAKNAIYDLVTSGTEVTVTMIYEKKSEKFNVTVNGGKLADGTTSGEYQVSTVMRVTANKAASGKKFSHWTTNGVIVSYNETYSFYMPSESITLEAVYVDNATEVEKTSTAIIESVTPNASTGKVAFVSVVNVPTNCTLLKGGVVATNDSNIGENVTDANAAYVRYGTPTKDSTKTYKYTWTKGSITADTIWYVRPYLVYRDENGIEHTVYGDAVKVNINGIIS